MTLRLWLLGAPRLDVNGEPVELTSAKALSLVAYLAMERDAHSRESLATLFWEDAPPERALTSLRQSLFKIRNTLTDAYIKTSRLAVQINPASDLWIDAEQLITLTLQKTRPPIADLVETVAFYRGEFMAGVNLPDAPEFENWQNRQRRRVESSIRVALNQIIDYQTEQADYEQAIRYASRLLSINPLDEAVHRSLMQLYLHADQPFAAIRQYRACVEILDRELGIVPEPATRDLYQQIIQREEAGEQPPPAASAGPVFPVGVYPPRPEVVVGRDADLARIRGLLSQERNAERRAVIAIQGWPGVGKSALAALLAHDSKTEALFPDGVLWTALGEHADVMGILSAWASALGIPGAPTDRNLTELTARLRGVLRKRRILFIIDDVWTADILQWFQFGGDGSALVITTRMNEIARELATSSRLIYKLGILDDKAAMLLMRQLAPDVTAAHPKEMLQLVHDLEGLPLALQVAGRLLQAELEMGWGVTDLLAELREGVALLEARAPADRADPVDHMPTTISALLAQSTNRLDDVNRLRFASLGLFAPKPATFSAVTLAALWEVDDPRDSIRILVNRGLMEPVGNGRFQVHALLVKHAQSLFADG